MALISIPNTFTVGAVIVASQHNSNFSTIYSDYNGNIDNTNLSASAAIVDTKLAQITTASKVSGAALTSLSSIPGGAGIIPVANIDTGTTANKIIILDGSAKLPAVDGSALTNLTSVTLSSILDYGTSASSSSAKSQNTLKVAWGNLTVNASSEGVLTNLPFSTTASYMIVAQYADISSTSLNSASCRKISASSAGITNAGVASHAMSWFAWGT